MAFASENCLVEGVCPAGHPMRSAGCVRRNYAYHALSPVRSFRNALEISAPDLIVPADDRSTHLLHELYWNEVRQHPTGSRLASLIERSLGSADSFPVVESRAKFLARANDLSIRVPKSIELSGSEALHEVASEFGYPFVLKADGTSGGYGVRIVHSQDESRSAFRSLHAPPMLARAIKRAIIDRDRNLLLPALTRRIPTISAQMFVQGSDVTSTVACWEGKVLGALHFEVVRKRYELGPASVMQWIDHPEMQAAVEKIVADMKLSGIHGFDFVLEKATGHAYLVEINPRTTQVGHLRLGEGRDLPGALCAASRGSEPARSMPVCSGQTVALFPQEWMRDPASTFIKESYHDVPWEEPKLLQLCIDRAKKQRLPGKSKQSALAALRNLGTSTLHEDAGSTCMPAEVSRLGNAKGNENLSGLTVTRK